VRDEGSEGDKVPRDPVGAPRGPVLATVATLTVDVYAGTSRSAPSSRRAPLRQGRPPLGHQGDPRSHEE